jgi:hypothetical protein
MIAALFLAASLVLAVEPPPAEPSPGATSAVEPAATLTPQAIATPKVPLREIGRIRATTAFCRGFVTHFNNSATTLLSNDAEISYIDFTLGGIEKHFRVFNSENLLHDDRIRLMAYGKILAAQLQPLQDEINALRRTAALTIDPVKAKEARDVAAALQKAYDKQRQIALDVQSVVWALVDATAGKTNTAINTSVPGPGSDDANMSFSPTAMRDVKSYLKFQNQLDRIGDAESVAATLADAVVDGC